MPIPVTITVTVTVTIIVTVIKPVIKNNIVKLPSQYTTKILNSNGTITNKCKLLRNAIIAENNFSADTLTEYASMDINSFVENVDKLTSTQKFYDD
ncbi:hypothetical protein V1478_005068 [Vespula squamosa]|uniref:Uncharacterized protein n=1 Tax=Vespula squamosa TaxID=30214 RepID=A0ABD2BD51_VESSQ